MSEILRQGNEYQGDKPLRSEYSLSKQLEELAEGENSFIMQTENPQIILDAQSHPQVSEQNLTLAQSELVQRPIEQHIQKVQNVATSHLENSAQQGSVVNQEVTSLRINEGLRASLPVLLTHQNPVFIQQHPHNFSSRLNQPATTMARPQSSQTQFAFPQNSNLVQQGQRVTLIQAVGQQGRPSSTSPPPKITFNYNVTNRNPQQPKPQPQPQPQVIQPRPQPPSQPNQFVQPQQQPIYNQPKPQPNQIIQPQLQPTQPQPHPQPIQPIQHHPQPFVAPPHRPQVISIPQNVQQPQFILPNPQPIPIPQNSHNQVIIWQKQYFFIVEKFQFYYQRMQIIHKKCIYLHEAINSTTKIEQLELLKTESNDLLLEITKTEQELAQAVQRNRGYLAESATWRQKYQQLSKAFEALKQNHNASVSSLQEKLTVLSKQLIDLEYGYNSAVQQSKQQAARAQGLEKQLLRLKEELKKNQNNSNNQSSTQELEKRVLQLSKLIEQKNTTISNLRKSIQDKKSTGNSQNTNNYNSQATTSIIQKELKRLQEQLIINQDLVVQLRAENQKLKANLKSNADVFEEKFKKHGLIIADYEKRVTEQAADIRNYQILIEQKNAEIATRKPTPNIVPAENNSQNSQLQFQNRRLQHQINLYEQSHLGELKMFNARLQQLTQRLRLASSDRQAVIKSTQEKIALLQSDLNRKDGTIRNLRDRILELEEEKRIRDLDRKYEPKPNQSSSISIQEVSSLKRQLNDKINEIEELQAQITEYKRMVNQYEDTISVKKHQINGLRRELEDKLNRSQDSTQLNSQLSKKQAELIEIKSRLADVEKLAGQNQLLKLEKNSLYDEVQRKLAQLSEANDKLYMFQKKIRELEGFSRQSPQISKLTEENELLHSAISKKDQEIAKIRQANQLLQTNAQQLQLEVEKLRSKLNSGQKNSQSQRSDLKNKLLSMQLKITEYERKSSGLQEVRVIMGQQISTLTTQINLKFEQIQRIESELKQERARSKSIEAELHSQIQQSDFARGKLKQWQRKYQALTKQLEAESEKKRDLTNTKKNELFNLNNRYIELQNASKNKDLRIRQLQKMIQSLNSKINTFDHNLEEIEYLKHKIVQYEHKVNQQGYRFTNKYIDSEPSQIFERKVIYQLKAENQLLRRQLGLAPKQEAKDFNIPQRDNQGVQERLNDFNKKLQDIISQHGNIDLTLNSQQLYKRFQRDRRLLIQKHNQQISQLKVRILQLESRGGTVFPKKQGNINHIFTEQLDFYKQKNHQLQERVQNHIKVNKQLKESIESLLRNHNGEPSILYYKEQLEKSSDTIANLQKQLKKANQQLKRLRDQAGKNNSRVIAEPIENQAKFIQITRRVSQLTLQISLLEKEKITREEVIEKYESESKKSKLMLEQLRITKDQFQRTLKQKQNNYNDQLARLTNKLRINQSQIERLQQILNKKQEQDSGETRGFKTKIMQLQEENKKLKIRVEQLIISEEKTHRQIARFENQVQMLMSEIQRLKESLDSSSKKMRDSDLQLQTLRLSNADFQAKLKSLEGQKQGYGYKQLQLQQEVARLTNQIKLLQAQIDRLNQFTQKKVSEKDSEITRLKLLISEKIQLISQFQDQIRQLKVFSFKSNEAAQEIFHLKEEINTLRSSLNFKSSQSQNRLREIRELTNGNQQLQQQIMMIKRGTENSSNELQSFIASLQSQLSESKKLRDNLAYEYEIKVRSLESQIKLLKEEKDQEIASLRSKLSFIEGGSRTSESTYESQIFQLKQLIQSLERHNQELQYSISTIKSSSQSENRRLSTRLEASLLEIQQKDFRIASFIEQLQRLQMQIQAVSSRSNQQQRLSQMLQRSVSTIEFLRNLLIEIQTLLQEGVSRKEAVQRMFSEIQVGLEEIRHWNSIL